MNKYQDVLMKKNLFFIALIFGLQMVSSCNGGGGTGTSAGQFNNGSTNGTGSKVIGNGSVLDESQIDEARLE